MSTGGCFHNNDDNDICYSKGDASHNKRAALSATASHLSLETAEYMEPKFKFSSYRSFNIKLKFIREGRMI